MLTRNTLDLLCCPACPEEPLQPDIREERDGGLVEADLRCAACGVSYPVRETIPDMVSSSLMSADEWTAWQQHLEGFQARRNKRLETPDAVINKFDKSLSMQEDFAAFTQIDGGCVLDVGCGPGKFRHRFAPPGPDYIGIDPIPLAECETFPFMRALAEKLPVRRDSVDHVTVLGALDHFKDRDAFLREVVRVLKPGGSFHLLQSVHEVRGPLSLLKWLAHEAKDALEDRTTKSEHADAPKHMHEYSRAELRELLTRHFRIEREKLYSPSLLNPYRLFVTMTPLGS
jgi:SAM-dependent methyltransferase